MATGFWLILDDKSTPCRITPSGRSRSLLGQFGEMLAKLGVALLGRLDQAARVVVLEDWSFRLWRRG
jgi:hypothetical protein